MYLDIEEIIKDCVNNNEVVTNSYEKFENREIYSLISGIFFFCDRTYETSPDIFITDYPDFFNQNGESVRQPVITLSKQQRFDVLLEFDKLGGYLPAEPLTGKKPDISKYTEPIIIFRCKNKYHLALIRMKMTKNV